MKLEEFQICKTFYCGGNKWLCTDKGTRVVIAVKVSGTHKVLTVDLSEKVQTTQEQKITKDWLIGLPYAVDEVVFDEYDQVGCIQDIEYEDKQN